MPDIYELQAQQAVFAIKTVGSDGSAVSLDVTNFPGDANTLLRTIEAKGYEVEILHRQATLGGKVYQQVVIRCWLDKKHRKYPLLGPAIIT